MRVVLIVSCLAISTAARAGVPGWPAFLNRTSSDSPPAAVDASGYRTETVTELRPVERTVERVETRSVPRTVTETVQQTVYDTVRVPETRRTMREVKDVSYRPVYETVQDVRTETVLKPVAETVWQTQSTLVTRQVQETVWREESVWTCKPVAQTSIRCVDFQVCLPVCETRACGTVMSFERVTETVCVDLCRTRPQAKCNSCDGRVSECRTRMVKGGILTGLGGKGCGGCEKECGKQGLCDRLCDRWQAVGDCLGDCGAKLGCKLANSGPLSQCLFIRIPDRIACTIVKAGDCCGGDACGCRECQQSRPVRPCETTIVRVPVQRSRYVAVHRPRTETVHRLARGAYVDRSALSAGTNCADDRVLGPNAAACVAADAKTYDQGGDGRVFVEGLRARRFISETVSRMENVCETRRVPETVCRTIEECVVTKVPVTTTKMVPVECRVSTSKLVARLQRVESTRLEPCEETVWKECRVPRKVAVCTTKQVCVTEKVKVPFTITDLVPTTVTRRVPCTDCAPACGSEACTAGRPCHAPGLLDGLRCRVNPCGSGCGNVDSCRCTPVRDFFQRLCCRIACKSCDCCNCQCDPCATAQPCCK